jgi:hypothetical protein
VAAAPGAIAIGAASWMGLYPSDIVLRCITLAAFGALGIGSYLAIATWLGLEEPRTLFQIALRRIRRSRTGVTPAP